MKDPLVVFIENSFELCKGLTFVEFICFRLFERLITVLYMPGA